MPLGPLQARTAHKKTGDGSICIAAVFECRPDESLLSAQHLASLYAADCSDKEVEDRAYRILLPLIRKQVSLFKEHPYLQTSGEFRIACAVCPQQTLFRGWSPLHIHAQKYWKIFPHQHRGYSKALTEVLQSENVDCLAAAATADVFAWPPVLLVDNGGGHMTFDGSLRRWKGLQGMDVPCTLNDMELEEVLAVYKKRKGDDRDVVVFPASEVGLLDVDKFTDAIDHNPQLSGCLKVRVSKDVHHEEKHPEKHKNGNGSKLHSAEDVEKCCRRGNEEDEASMMHSHFDYEEHHPLGTWATLKEIRDTGRVDSIMGKWAKGFAIGNDSSFTYRWPFQKSKQLRDMDVKFQESLHKYHASGAVGNEKLRVQLDAIEKQLRKERLLWLKEIKGVREQFEELQRDLCNEEAQKILDKRIQQMKIEKEIDGESDDEESEELSSYRSKLERALCKKRHQHMRDKERNHEVLLRGWRYEQDSFRKQAELAKEERDCISRSLENEEMLDSISRILEGCGCCHKGHRTEECSCCQSHCSSLEGF